jgi:hypothetical protein
VSITTERLNAETSSLNVKLNVNFAKDSTARMDITCVIYDRNSHYIRPTKFHLLLTIIFLLFIYFTLFKQVCYLRKSCMIFMLIHNKCWTVINHKIFISLALVHFLPHLTTNKCFRVKFHPGKMHSCNAEMKFI